MPSNVYHCNSCCCFSSSQNTYQETDFLPFVKEYSLYTDSIKVRPVFNILNFYENQCHLKS